jgi:hypothetical protein
MDPPGKAINIRKTRKQMKVKLPIVADSVDLFMRNLLLNVMV